MLWDSLVYNQSHQWMIHNLKNALDTTILFQPDYQVPQDVNTCQYTLELGFYEEQMLLFEQSLR